MVIRTRTRTNVKGPWWAWLTAWPAGRDPSAIVQRGTSANDEVTRMDQMSIYHYCRPTDGVLNSKGSLSRAIVSSVLAEVNREVKLVAAGKKKKRGSYLSFTPEEKAQIAQYGSVNGV